MFSTEGHLLFLPNSLRASPLKPSSQFSSAKSILSSFPNRKVSNKNSINSNICPVYSPTTDSEKYPIPLQYSITSRNDFEWSRVLSGLRCNNNSNSDNDCEQFNPWYPYGSCNVPLQEDYVSVYCHFVIPFLSLLTF